MIDENWQPYKGGRLRVYVDVTLKNGTQLDHCWPDEKHFRSRSGDRIESSEVSLVRRSELQGPMVSTRPASRFPVTPRVKKKPNNERGR